MKIVVGRYPYAGATGLTVEEDTSYGAVEILSTTTIGTFPDYTTEYTIAPISSSRTPPLRYRWELGSVSSSWSSEFALLVTPTAEQLERITQAIIAKATRILVSVEAPLGVWGELSEFGIATVRPDYQSDELLFGLRLTEWDVDLTTLVTADDVIRVGLQTVPADFPAERIPDVERSIAAAVSWLAEYVQGPIGVT